MGSVRAFKTKCWLCNWSCPSKKLDMTHVSMGIAQVLEIGPLVLVIRFGAFLNKISNIDHCCMKVANLPRLICYASCCDCLLLTDLTNKLLELILHKKTNKCLMFHVDWKWMILKQLQVSKDAWKKPAWSIDQQMLLVLALAPSHNIKFTNNKIIVYGW